MGMFDNPFVPFPPFDYLSARLRYHFDPEFLRAKRIEHEEWCARREAYFAGKPPGTQDLYELEERLYAAGEPFKASFNPNNCPPGVSYSEHLMGIVTSAQQLGLAVMRELGVFPKCGLAEVGIAYLLDVINNDAGTKEAEPCPQSYRSSMGKLAGRTDLHREPDCSGPYFIPRGELWLMLAWRYDFPEERRTEWARPVAILQFDGYIEPAMVTIARCAR